MTRSGAVVLSTFIDALEWRQAVDQISAWARRRESRSVCCCNAHSVVTAVQDSTFHEALAVADMATADGMPIAWMLRRLGFPQQQRVSGPDLMWNCCAAAAAEERAIFLFGSSDSTLTALYSRLLIAFPELEIAGTYSPPYRPLTLEENAKIVDQINTSGASVVFVSLGCPKQERWIAEHLGLINAVMIGVGAAFDYHAGILKRAPKWMRNTGLEWLYRLNAEPGRLWKRYMVTNSLFLIGVARQLLNRANRTKSRHSP